VKVKSLAWEFKFMIKIFLRNAAPSNPIQNTNIRDIVRGLSGKSKI